MTTTLDKKALAAAHARLAATIEMFKSYSTDTPDDRYRSSTIRQLLFKQTQRCLLQKAVGRQLGRL